jgi:hypothetical protein
MTATRRVMVELVLAMVALAGAGYSASRVTSVADNAPITEGEPPTTSVMYHAPWLTLTLLLVTTAAVLVVLAVARWRRSSSAR